MSSTTTPSNVLHIPNYPWLDRLRPGHLVWLVKQKEVARVVAAWEPPGTLSTIGRIFIQPKSVHRPIPAWHVDGYGRGFDSSQLFAPIKESLPMSETHQINQRIDALESTILRLVEAFDSKNNKQHQEDIPDGWKLVRADEIEAGEHFVKRTAGIKGYAYLRISDSALKYYRLNGERHIYGVCYNGNMSAVERTKMVWRVPAAQMEINRGTERQWEEDMGCDESSSYLR